jgi:hypothetical protein
MGCNALSRRTPKAVIPLVQIVRLQRTEFFERCDYRDFTGSIPLLRAVRSVFRSATTYLFPQGQA